MTVAGTRSDLAAPVRSPWRVRLAGLAVALLAAAALAFTDGTRIDGLVFDQWQRLYPRDLAGMRVQIVQIDPESIRELGPWPWSRATLADLTTRIGDNGATAIGFDALFPEVDRQTPALFVRRYPELAAHARGAVLALPSLDEAFAQRLGRYPTVLARAGVTERSIDFGEPIYRDPARLPVEAAFSAALPGGVQAWPQAISSIPAIEENAAGHGLINGDPDPDGIIRRVPAVGVIGGIPTPGFAMELARIASGEETLRPIVASGRLGGMTLGRHRLPVEPDGRFRPHFGRVPGANVTSAADVFRRGYDLRRAFSGKVAVISVTGLGTADVVTTPIEAEGYGVDVQAQAVDAILRDGWLVRPRWANAAEIAAGLALALVSILLFPRLRRGWTVAAPLLLGSGVIAASAFAFTRVGLLFDPLRPLLIGGTGGLGVLATLFAEGVFTQRALREALVDERVLAARAAGELAAARDIQQGMLPARASLAALDAAFDIDAVLEAAREVGGDFYDAFHLPDGRIAFLIGDVTGKGVPAALFMALSKALARSVLLRHAAALDTALAMLATELAQDNSEAMFVTLLVGVADAATGEIALVNAGHEDPLLIRADGRIVPVHMEGGPPLCVVEDYPYPIERIVLGHGDGLLLVTDGVTEAQTADGRLFDRDALLASLGALGPGWEARLAIDALLDAVRAFEAGAEPSDDLTAMLVRRR